MSGGNKELEKSIGELPYDEVVLLVYFKNAEQYAEAELHEKLLK